jgi:hypothetical protein
MDDTQLTFVTHSPVYHVGALDADRPQTYSYEGGGLSVSTHPDAWREIADSVSGHTYELTNESARFVLADDRLERQARAWCLDNGFVTATTGYRASTVDPEVGERRYWLFEDRPSAAAQVFGHPEGCVEPVPTLALDDRGRAYTVEVFAFDWSTDPDPMDVRDLTLVWFAEHALDVDGVWWADRLDPAACSAPRGVIFQSRLDAWTVDPGGSGSRGQN